MIRGLKKHHEIFPLLSLCKANSSARNRHPFLRHIPCYDNLIVYSAKVGKIVCELSAINYDIMPYQCFAQISGTLDGSISSHRHCNVYSQILKSQQFSGWIPSITEATSQEHTLDRKQVGTILTNTLSHATDYTKGLRWITLHILLLSKTSKVTSLK